MTGYLGNLPLRMDGVRFSWQMMYFQIVLSVTFRPMEEEFSIKAPHIGQGIFVKVDELRDGQCFVS